MYFSYQAPISYPDKRNIKYSTIIPKILGVMVLSLFISACTITSQMGSQVDEDSIVTGSVAESAKPQGVEGTDAEVIKSIVAYSDIIEPQTSELAWSNPDTGNKGTIVAIDKFIGSHGQSCKKFQTTVDSFVGISLYDGETCEVKRGMWVLSWFMRR